MSTRLLPERFRNDPVISALVRDSGPLYAAGALTVALTIGQQLITARFLGPGDYGRFASALGFVVIVGLLLDVRTWELGTRLLARPLDVEDPRACSTVFSWIARLEAVTGLAGVAAVVVLSPLIDAILDGDGLVPLLVVLSPTVLARQVAVGVSAATVRMLGRYHWLGKRSVVVAVVRLVLIAGAAVAGMDLFWIGAAAAVSDVIGAASMVWMARRAFYSRFAVTIYTRDKADPETTNWPLVRALWLSATIKTLHVESYVPVAAAFTPAHQIGLLRNGMDVGNMTTQLVAPVSMVISPQIMLLTQRGDRFALQSYLKRVRRLLAVGVGAATVIGVAGVFTLLPTILGEGYDSVRSVAAVLLVALGVSAATIWVRPLLVGLDAVGAQNRLGVLTGILSIGALPVVVIRWGAIGAATDLLAFLCLYAWLSVLLVRRRMDERFPS